MSVAGTEKGKVSGEEMFSSGTAIGKAPGGEVTSPGYAKGKASADGSLTAAAPRYSENPLPAYPITARQQGYAGVVMLSVEVLTDGSVGRLEIKKSSGYDILDTSARKAVQRWKFFPAKKAGIPVIMWVEVPVRFALTILNS